MKTIEDLRHLSLNQADIAYREGLLTTGELDLYLAAWNNGLHFTEAYFCDGAIRQRSKP
jgi:hypothetical protein